MDFFGGSLGVPGVFGGSAGLELLRNRRIPRALGCGVWDRPSISTWLATILGTNTISWCLCPAILECLINSSAGSFSCCALARSGCIDCDYRWFNSVWSGLCHELFDSFLYGSCLHRFRKRKPERRFLLHGQRSWTINRNVTIGSYFSSWRNASLLVDVLFAGGLSLAHQPSLTTNVEIIVFTAN